MSAGEHVGWALASCQPVINLKGGYGSIADSYHVEVPTPLSNLYNLPPRPGAFGEHPDMPNGPPFYVSSEDKTDSNMGNHLVSHLCLRVSSYNTTFNPKPGLMSYELFFLGQRSRLGTFDL
ncbi:hypothetical protein OIU77_021101 [Salix suchowensis]|uniref:Uncharacterized protein n=1 Tax=Salix suchowensis TaxID=1278906 RepID=A0ABQ9CC28_9ROSI|nr:hypothetical protein OIU77_021101 [Salix suchowensis]